MYGNEEYEDISTTWEKFRLEIDQKSFVRK